MSGVVVEVMGAPSGDGPVAGACKERHSHVPLIESILTSDLNEVMHKWVCSYCQ